MLDSESYVWHLDINMYTYNRSLWGRRRTQRNRVLLLMYHIHSFTQLNKNKEMWESHLINWNGEEEGVGVIIGELHWGRGGWSHYTIKGGNPPNPPRYSVSSSAWSAWPERSPHSTQVGQYSLGERTHAWWWGCWAAEVTEKHQHPLGWTGVTCSCWGGGQERGHLSQWCEGNQLGHQVVQWGYHRPDTRCSGLDWVSVPWQGL